MIEKWTAVKGWPHYSVSSFGRVLGPSGRILTPVRNSTGYLQVSLCGKDAAGRKKITNRKIHHLVLEGFVGERPSKHCAAHSDGNPENNHVDNLSWQTQWDNIADKTRHGTHGRKLTPDQVKEIRVLRKQGLIYKEIADRFGIDRTLAQKIGQGVIWRHV